MKNFTICFFLTLAAFSTYGQLEITLYGDSNDSTLIRRKKSMEEKGFNVKIKPEGSKEDDSKDNPFIARWINQKLPFFEITDLEGNTLTTDDLRGKFIHINFWSVTCKPCIEEFPELNQLKEKYGEDVVFIAIAPESEKKVSRVLNKHKLNYRSVADAKPLFDELGIDGYPKNLFISRDGIIEKIIDGTHYKIESVDDKMKTVPDNFKYYDEALEKILKSDI